MKKFYLFFTTALVLFFLILSPGSAQASQCAGATGLVPCGPKTNPPPPVPIFFLILSPGSAQASQCAGATGLVPCGQNATCPCEIQDFFVMLAQVAFCPQ